jgi:hypothetical protein
MRSAMQSSQNSEDDDDDDSNDNFEELSCSHSSAQHLIHDEGQAAYSPMVLSLLSNASRSSAKFVRAPILAKLQSLSQDVLGLQVKEAL